MQFARQKFVNEVSPAVYCLCIHPSGINQYCAKCQENGTKRYQGDFYMTGGFLQIIIKRFWAVAITAIIIAAAIIALYLSLMVPGYEVSNVIMISNRTDERRENVAYEDLLASQKLAYAFRELYYSGAYREDLVKNTGIPADRLEMLEKDLRVEVKQETNIVTVTLHNGAEDQGARLLGSICGTMVGSFTRLTGTKNIKIVGQSQSQGIVHRRALRFVIAIAFLAGLVIAVAAVVIYEKLSDTIRTTDDVNKNLGVSVLGVIPQFKDERGKTL